jgi:hypothetical protein
MLCLQAQPGCGEVTTMRGVTVFIGWMLLQACGPGAGRAAVADLGSREADSVPDVAADGITPGPPDLSCTPSCEKQPGWECWDDGCGGTCGECGETRICVDHQCLLPDPCTPWETNGICAGPKSFVHCDGTGQGWVVGYCDSPLKCHEGECTDGCQPGQKICQGMSKVQEMVEGESGGCEWQLVEDCSPGLCSGGECVPCEPDCDGKQCGDDGCGGECGSCPCPECEWDWTVCTKGSCTQWTCDGHLACFEQCDKGDVPCYQECDSHMPPDCAGEYCIQALDAAGYFECAALCTQDEEGNEVCPPEALECMEAAWALAWKACNPCCPPFGSDLTCGELHQCLLDCPGGSEGQACAQLCFAHATVEALTLWDQLIGCLDEQGYFDCAEEAPDCLDDAWNACSGALNECLCGNADCPQE